MSYMSVLSYLKGVTHEERQPEALVKRPCWAHRVTRPILFQIARRLIVRILVIKFILLFYVSERSIFSPRLHILCLKWGFRLYPLPFDLTVPFVSFVSVTCVLPVSLDSNIIIPAHVNFVHISPFFFPGFTHSTTQELKYPEQSICQ